MTRYSPVFSSLAFGAWILLTPPTPLGTALPPLSEWVPASTHETSAACEQARETMREAARTTATRDPNASALKVAAALGQLEARCVESKAGAPAPAK
jgi:hypothetical protein